MKIHYTFEAKHKTYRLIAHFEETGNSIKIFEWVKKPSPVTVSETKWIFERACNIYHDQIIKLIKVDIDVLKETA